MTASIGDILTAAKNIVTAINGAAQAYINVNGSISATSITSATLLKTGAGRIATISVVASSATTGAIYDTNSASSTANKIGVIPATVGITIWNIPYTNGLVVVPGSGQTVTISYS